MLIALLQQDNDAGWVKQALDHRGVPCRPEEIGVTWPDCVQALQSIASYAAKANLWFTSASHQPITEEYLDAAQELVYR